MLTGLVLAALLGGLGVGAVRAHAGDRAGHRRSPWRSGRAGLRPGGGHRPGLCRDGHRPTLAGGGAAPCRDHTAAFGPAQVERARRWPTGAPPTPPPRPASVEVEISRPTATAPEVVETELPESVRELLQQTIELTRRDVSELMTPRSAIVTLPSSVSASMAAQTFRQTGHEPHPGLRREPRRHHRHPLRQGPLPPDDRPRRPRRDQPPQACPPRALRPRDQERLRPARGVPHAADPDRDRARRVRRRRRPDHPRGPPRRAGRHDRRRARRPTRNPTQ